MSKAAFRYDYSPKDGIVFDSQTPGFCVIDNAFILSRQREVDMFLQQSGWVFGWRSKPSDDPFSFFHIHFAGHLHPDDVKLGGLEIPYDCEQELKNRSSVIYAIWHDLKLTVLLGHTLVRCYANAAPYGCEGSTHTDSISPNSYTTIYYPHAQWTSDWAGETVFFTPDKTDIVAAIYPKPNRLVIFNGTIPHVARAVSRTCPAMRVTLMFKTEIRGAG